MSVQQSGSQYKKPLDTSKSLDDLEAEFRKIGNAGYKAGVLALETPDGIDDAEQHSLMNMAWHVLNHGDANKVAALGALLADSVQSGDGTKNAADISKLLDALKKAATHRGGSAATAYADLQKALIERATSNTVRSTQQAAQTTGNLPSLNMAKRAMQNTADLATLKGLGLDNILDFGQADKAAQDAMIAAAKGVVASGDDKQRRALGRLMGQQAQMSPTDRSIIGELKTEFFGDQNTPATTDGHGRDFVTVFNSFDDSLGSQDDIEQQINALPNLLKQGKPDTQFQMQLFNNIAEQMGGYLDKGVTEGLPKIAKMLQESLAKSDFSDADKQKVTELFFGKGANLDKIANGDIKNGLPQDAESFSRSLTGFALGLKLNDPAVSNDEIEGLRKALPDKVCSALLPPPADAQIPLNKLDLTALMNQLRAQNDAVGAALAGMTPSTTNTVVPDITQLTQQYAAQSSALAGLLASSGNAAPNNMVISPEILKQMQQYAAMGNALPPAPVESTVATLFNETTPSSTPST